MAAHGRGRGLRVARLQRPQDGGVLVQRRLPGVFGLHAPAHAGRNRAVPAIEKRPDHAGEHRVAGHFGDREMETTVGVDGLSPVGEVVAHRVQGFFHALQPGLADARRCERDDRALQHDARIHQLRRALAQRRRGHVALLRRRGDVDARAATDLDATVDLQRNERLPQ